MTAADGVRALLRAGRLDLPPIGAGRTAARWQALLAIARADLSVGRLAEAHVDAVQILAEAGRTTTPGALWGVWASEVPGHAVRAERRGGRLVLAGRKPFCSGAGIVDRALVTAVVDGEERLLDVPTGVLAPGRVDLSGWATPALAGTATGAVDLTDLEVDADAVVGGPRWYLDRPGFWHGAIGPAACWAGGAIALADRLTTDPPDDPHARAHAGAAAALAWSLRAALDRAGAEIDEAGPDEAPAAARRRALVVRHLTDVAAAEIAERVSRVRGPRLLAGDPEVVELDQALRVYRRQCHAERDLDELGRLLGPP